MCPSRRTGTRPGRVRSLGHWIMLLARSRRQWSDARPFSRSVKAGSDEAVHPAARIGGATELDVEQRLAHGAGHLAGGAVTDHALAVRLDQPGHRRHDGGGAAREHLADPAGLGALAPLVDRDATLVHLVAAL